MEIDDEAIETMARRIHANYVTAPGASAAGRVPWEELSEDLREANRAQARAIVAKLDRVGAVIVVGPGEPFAFTDEEIALLAREEHDRWARQRRAAGWRFGRVRDDRDKRHPMLVPWHRLSRVEKDKDRAAVRNVPDVLAAAGLSARRH